MVNWMYRLELKDLWDKFDDGKINICIVGKETAKRLRDISFPSEFSDKIEWIAKQFENTFSVDVFNITLETLYDIADIALSTPPNKMQRKLMWINTF